MIGLGGHSQHLVQNKTFIKVIVQMFCVVFPGSGVSVEPDNHWGSQINQLEQLIDKLEFEVCMKSVSELPAFKLSYMIEVESMLIYSFISFLVFLANHYGIDHMH